MVPHNVTTSRAKAALLGLTLVAATASAQARAPYLDPTLPVERRIDDLLSRMTLEEKVGQMLCLWQGKRAITDRDGRFDPARAPKWFRMGVGRIERPGESHGARAEAEYTNAIQRWVKDSTRLGIPVLFHEEALHGLEAEQATSFPQAIALASTWNPEIVERVFAAAAAEARARGVHQVLAPVVDVARDPRWGRIEETYGEDPYLAARMGVAAVRGFQGYGQLGDQGRQGRGPEATIDSVGRRLLRPKFELGLFEDPFVDPGEADPISGAAASRNPALDAARQAITLLKNDHQLLPLAA